MNVSDQARLFLDTLAKRKDVWNWVLRYGAVFTVFLFFFLPGQSRLSSYTAERDSLKKQISDLKQIMNTLLTPEEIERVKGRVDNFESKLADLTKTNAILDEVSKLAEENHLKMIQIYSDSPILVKDNTGKELEVSGKKLSLLPVNFRVQADYKSLGNFLKDMHSQAQWSFTVESLQLQTPEEDAGGSLQCDVTLSYIVR